MTSGKKQERSIELLHELELRGYEARCFVALSRMPRATAKEISEISDVPRTRVYDVIRVLEARGMVEVQHSRPQQFRAVPLDEALLTLRGQYESRIRTLRNALTGIEPAEDRNGPLDDEVWSLTGPHAIVNRFRQIIGDAEDEIVLILGNETSLNDRLIDCLEHRAASGIGVVVGTIDKRMKESVDECLPVSTTFVSKLDWLRPPESADSGMCIGVMGLVDRDTVLISSIDSVTNAHRAVFGRGVSNVLVTIVRRLLANAFQSYDRVGYPDG